MKKTRVFLALCLYLSALTLFTACSDMFGRKNGGSTGGGNNQPFFIGKWHSNDFQELVGITSNWKLIYKRAYETCELRIDGTYENLRIREDERYAGWRGTAVQVNDTTLKCYHNVYKSYDDDDFTSYSGDETISFEKIDNDHFIMLYENGKRSPRMYEREGASFDVNVSSIAGVYEGEDGEITLKSDGSFEGVIEGDDFSGTLIFNKNKITVDIPLAPRNGFGMYASDVLFVEGYKFVKKTH